MKKALRVRQVSRVRIYRVRFVHFPYLFALLAALAPDVVVPGAWFSGAGGAGAGSSSVYAQQVASLQSVSQRVFVTGVTPVFGPRGVVGGVAIDAEGVVSRATQADLKTPGRWRDEVEQVSPALESLVGTRMVSLRRLDRALAETMERRELPTAEMFFLAGLQRIEFVFVDSLGGDLIIGGPAEGWRIHESGAVVGRSTGQPVLRLDDLMDAVRAIDVERHSGISCSIEPTPEGLRRYARQLQRLRGGLSRSSLLAMQRAMGPQQVLIDGVRAESHYARVMVAADLIMKRLAMGLEEPPVVGLPDYLQRLRDTDTPQRITSPRWWITLDGDPIVHSSDRMVWRVPGRRLKVLTADSLLDDRGQRRELGLANPVAESWGNDFTNQIPKLVTRYPVIGQLRNCADLSVVAALIQKRDLFVAAELETIVLNDSERLRGAELAVPKTVDSQASFVRSRRGWIVSVSGGVDIDPWAAVEDVRLDPSLDSAGARVPRGESERWWW